MTVAQAPARVSAPARDMGATALALVPAALLLALAFRGGGFFVGPTAIATLILVQILFLRVALDTKPLVQLRWHGALPVAAFTGYALWALASMRWSDTPGTALTEFNRALLYLTVLALFAIVPWTAGRVRLMVYGLGAAMTIVCGAGLLSRLLPEQIPVDLGSDTGRLAFPLTYWNALGLVAALGIVICLHLTAGGRESPRSARVLGSAALPVLTCCLYFTFSRAGAWAAVLGVLIYVAIARPPGLIGALVAAGPPIAAVLVAATQTGDLSSRTPTTAAAIEEGRELGLLLITTIVLAGSLRWLLLRLDAARPPDGWFRVSPGMRTALAGAGVVLALGGAGGLVAAGVVDRVLDRFVADPTVRGPTLASRYLEASSNGRIDHWRVSLDGLERSPLHGTGIGTYVEEWERQRPGEARVVDGHSLFVETLGELGIVGLVLLCLALLGLAVAIARAPLDRCLRAVLMSAVFVWLLHAGVDWDWEMPATSAWVFAVGGAALAMGRGATPRAIPDSRRVALGLGCLATAITPVLVTVSEGRLVGARSALHDGDCGAAQRSALSSLSALAVRAEPYEVLAFCHLERGFARPALDAAGKAAEYAPRSWEPQLLTAIARSANGLSPSAALRLASTRNPREPLVGQVRDVLRRQGVLDPVVRARAAARLALVSGHVSLTLRQERARSTR